MERKGEGANDLLMAETYLVFPAPLTFGSFKEINFGKVENIFTSNKD